MYSPEPEEISHAARAYLQYLPHNIHSAIEELLTLADAGQKVDNHIIDLMGDDKAAKEWMRQLYSPENAQLLSYRSKPLGGGPQPILAQEWVCPLVGCEFTWYIDRVGKPISFLCPRDRKQAVPVNTIGN